MGVGHGRGVATQISKKGCPHRAPTQYPGARHGGVDPGRPPNPVPARTYAVPMAMSRARWMANRSERTLGRPWAIRTPFGGACVARKRRGRSGSRAVGRFFGPRSSTPPRPRPPLQRQPPPDATASNPRPVHPQQRASSYYGPATPSACASTRRRVLPVSLVQNHFSPLSAWKTRC